MATDVDVDDAALTRSVAQAVLEHPCLSVVVLDVHGSVMHHNTRASHEFVRTTGEILHPGMGLAGLCAGAYRLTLERAFMRALRGRSVQVECTWQGPGRRLQRILYTYVALRDSWGHIVGVCRTGWSLTVSRDERRAATMLPPPESDANPNAVRDPVTGSTVAFGARSSSGCAARLCATRRQPFGACTCRAGSLQAHQRLAWTQRRRWDCSGRSPSVC